VTHRAPPSQVRAPASPDSLAGDRRALADALTRLELGGASAAALLANLAPALGRTLVVGVTGPPGAGKSTLVNALIREWRGGGLTVAVIAVDPSSPISGGAILGDRIRMSAALDDDGVFVRSLASGGYVGGLSPAAVRLVDGFDAAGFDRVLIETVGAGQTEIDVARVADIRIVVAAPGLGDGIQAMKSGILEIADILVVNKADREGAARTRQELDAALMLRAAAATVPVVETVATSGQGVERLARAVAAAQATLPPAAERRRRRARYLIQRAAEDYVRRALAAAPRADVDDMADSVLAGTLVADDAVRRLLTRLEDGQP